MKATETLIYTNTATNQSVSISFLSNLIPTAFDEDVDASFYTDKNSGQDGETLQNLDLEPREITIKAVFQLTATTVCLKNTSKVCSIRKRKAY